MRTISLIRNNSFSEQFHKDYSRFKHGSKSIARNFGKELATICLFAPNSNLVVYSAPHKNIHTASNALKDYLLSGMANHIYENNLSIVQSKVNRDYSYDDDYGSMSANERALAISSDMFHIDKSIIKPNDILVFVDDIRITGSHENRIKELIKRENILNEVVFVYYSEYTGSDPTIENRLNHKSVNTLLDINNIIRNDEFIFNTRVVKYILSDKFSHTAFFNFIIFQSLAFKETLFSLAILNGYKDNEKYKKSISTLKGILENGD